MTGDADRQTFLPVCLTRTTSACRRVTVSYTTNLLCDKVPVWGLLPLGGLYGLEIPPFILSLLADLLERSPSNPASKAKAPGMPTEIQI